ncbi:MAG: hypothetical protein K2Q06_04555 [Parvularculaceae bacterium]|nr:hypothetical protein [Parvularculaceae bacterium]
MRGGLLAGLILLSNSLFWPEVSGASPWGQAPGDVFVATRASFLVAKAPPPDASAGAVRLSRQEQDVYVEAGLGRRLTVGGKFDYGSSAYADGFENFTSSGVQEAEGFAQYRLAGGGRDVLSARIIGGGFTRRQFAGRTGAVQGGADAEMRLAYGRTLTDGPINLFVTAEAGYRRRFGPGADQVRTEAMIGLQRRRAYVIAGARATNSIGPAGRGGSDFDIVKLEGVLVVPATRRLSVTFGGAHEVAGRATLRGDAAFVGMWARL